MGDLCQQLAECLCGTFSNRSQAIADPAWYVNLQLWQVILPKEILGGYALFAEQANVLDLSKPYRQRVLHIQSVGSQSSSLEALQVQYYALKQPGNWRGAGADPNRLLTMTMDDLQFLPKCLLTVTYAENYFTASLAPDCACFFDYNGEQRQVSLGFRTNGQELISYDKGLDPATGSAIWGAIAGGYHFQKI